MDNQKRGVLLFSGGLDSTTTLYHAIQNDYILDLITFSYSQKHLIEIEKAKLFSNLLNIKNHLVYNLDPSIFISSALTSNLQVPKNRKNILEEKNIPVTYVPARNLIFLSIATAYAESHSIGNIFIGINNIDYSGYPDCRPNFINSCEKTINLATGKENIRIHSPLLNMTKIEIIQYALKLNLPFEHTWSCYDPLIKNNILKPCLECDSCLIRIDAFNKAGVIDPSYK